MFMFLSVATKEADPELPPASISIVLLPYCITVQSACPTSRNDTVKSSDGYIVGVREGVVGVILVIIVVGIVVGVVDIVLVVLGVNVWLGLVVVDIGKHPAIAINKIMSNSANRLPSFF